MLNRDAIRIGLIATAITIAGFALAYQFVEPSPPKHITIAAGSQGGAYYAFAKRYAEILGRDGIRMEVLETGGSVDNIERLYKEEADVAFIQGGVGDAESQSNLQSLGSLYFEPLWVFVKASSKIHLLSDLKARPLAAGGEGSGTWAVTKQLLQLNAIDTSAPAVLHLSTADAVPALRKGEVEAAFFVASPTAPLIQDLLADPKLRVLSFDRAEAYVSRLRQLSAVTLYEGVISLSGNVPPKDIVLLAPAASLVAPDTLHPALVSLLARATREVHGQGGLFEKPGQFPSILYSDYPINDDAKRFIVSGPPFLQRFLPFWAAVAFDRLAVMLVPLITLMIPLSKVLPPVYRWRVRSRIFRWYETLGRIERRHRAGEDRQLLLRELDAMANEVSALKVPLSYSDELYDLRLHMDLIRRDLMSVSFRA